MNELVSVIVPVYMVEKYLHQCLDSILSQTYQRLEVILIDDGSEDECGQICDHYSRIDERVTVLHQRNRGLSAARNAGLSLAKGEFVTFIDSDDWVHASFVGELVNLVDKTGADVSVCRLLRTTGQGVPVPDSEMEVAVYSNVEALRLLLEKRLYETMVVSCAKLYRRQLFDGVRFPAGRCHEDEFISHKLIWEARSIVLTSAHLYYYRQHPGSFMATSHAPRPSADARDAIRDRADFFHRIGLEMEAEAIYHKLLQMYFRDFHAARRRGDRLLAMRLSQEVTALAILRAGAGHKLPITIALYRFAPWLLDAYLEWRV